jgi:protein involved in polysaccharide export with SLBB domain
VYKGIILKITSIFLSIAYSFIYGLLLNPENILANDNDDKNFLMLQNQSNSAYETLLGNKDNSIRREKATDNENSIDPSHYYIGGGDEFVISVIGLPSINYSVTINQQGDMYIPELGLLKLGKITLAEAQNKIVSYVGEKLKKNNEIYVQLNKIKSVTINVAGAVANPGTYVLSGGNRIFDAIRAANKELTPSLNECDYRNVLCKNNDSTKTIDLFGYLLKNDISKNPYLYPGDNISLFLSTKKVLLNSITKTGLEGWIPIKDDEILSEFLSFQRFDFSVDTSRIFIQSVGENGIRSMKNILWNDAGSVILHDKDIITIPVKKNYSPVFFVSINGEVARPGSYSILRDSTTAREIIANAGGPTAHGDMDRAVILRNLKVEQSQQNRKSGIEDKLQETKSIRPEMMSGLEKMSLLSDYSILELKRFGTETKLEENDQIIIPAIDKFVYISGNVKRPGAYEYSEGKKKEYYINKAGGYTGKASKTNAFGMRYYEKACQQTDLSEIVEGDIIIVPESQQGKALTSIVLPIIGMVLSTLGTIVTIFVLLR